MSSDEKWDFINRLDEELLQGGVMLSEWTTFLVRDADTAFCADAPLGAILAAQAAIESHLRYEYPESSPRRKASFYDLIEGAPIDEELRAALHELRRFRNRWVHVNDPAEDADLLQRPEYHQQELEARAREAIRTLRQVLYLEQMV